MTHIRVSNLAIIGSYNGLSPDRCQAIIWTNAGILLIGPVGTNFSEILIEILKVSLKKMRLEVSSAKWRPFCLGLHVLKNTYAMEPVISASSLYQSQFRLPFVHKLLPNICTTAKISLPTFPLLIDYPWWKIYRSSFFNLGLAYRWHSTRPGANQPSSYWLSPLWLQTDWRGGFEWPKLFFSK